MKTVNLVLIILVIVLLAGNIYLMRKEKPVNITETHTETKTTIPVKTVIIERNLPAIIDTIWVNNESIEIATYKTVIDTNKVTVDLSISYNEKSNVFSLDSSVTALVDSVYVEKEKIVYMPKKIKPIGLTMGLGLSMLEQQYYPQIDAGIKLFNKYSITGTIDTEKKLGIRFGVDF